MPEDYRGFNLGQPDRQRPPGDVDPGWSLVTGSDCAEGTRALFWLPSVSKRRRERGSMLGCGGSGK